MFRSVRVMSARDPTRPSTSPGALRIRRDKSAARGGARASSRGKRAKKIWKMSVFTPRGAALLCAQKRSARLTRRFRDRITVMRTALLLVIVSASCLVASVAHAAAATREQWIIQTRAADAIGAVLTGASERAHDEVDRLRRELANAGEKPAAARATSTATRESEKGYRALLDQVVAEV